MFKRTMLAAVIAVAFFSGAGGAYAGVTGGDSGDILPSNELSYWKGTREELRANCAGLLGILIESHGKTKCYSEYRQALYICKSSGLCQTQPWNPQVDGPPTGGHSHGPGYGSSLSQSGEGGGVYATDDEDDGGPIIIL